MELTRPGYAVIYVILLCALAQGGSEGKRAKDNEFSKDVAISSSSSLNVYAKEAEVVLKHSRKALTERNNDVKDFDIHTLGGISDIKCISLIENNINKATKSLPPQLINKILDCIRISSSSISELKAISRHHLTSDRRRYLISEDHSSADDPSSDSSELPPIMKYPPDSDVSPSFPDIYEPYPRSRQPPQVDPHAAPLLYPTHANPSIASSPPGSNNNDDGKQRTTIIVVVIIVTGIVVVIGMFLCYRVVKAGKVEKEGGPLLARTSKDYTGGSPKVVHSRNANSKDCNEESGIDNGKSNGKNNEKSTSITGGSSIKAEYIDNMPLVGITSSEAVGKALEPPTAKHAPPLPSPSQPSAPQPPALAVRPLLPPRAMSCKFQLRTKQDGFSDGDDAANPKVKPFFWDKIIAKVNHLGDADSNKDSDIDNGRSNGKNNGKSTSTVRSLSMKAEYSNNTPLVGTGSSEAVGKAPESLASKPAPLPPGLPPLSAPQLPALTGSGNTPLVGTTLLEAVGKAQEPPAAKPVPPPPGPPPPSAPQPPALAPLRHSSPAHPKAMAGKNKLGPKQDGPSDGDSTKPKLKPFFWDKVAAKSNPSMVWHEINGGSFEFNEQKMESLFGFVNQDTPEQKKDSSSADKAVRHIQIIDPKKAQNLSIILRALNVTTNEVVDALKDGNKLPVELIQTILKVMPTTDEELKLRLFTGEISQLGPAERFLKVLVDIPFASKRLESLMFMCIYPEESTRIKECLATLEVACNKLRKSRLFLKLLEAVLKTGNRMNDGTYRGGAQAFRLDTLLKLSDVKGTDGKTTLLHFVVQEIIRYEGIRAARAEKESSNSSMSSVKTEDLDDDDEETAEHYRSLGLQVVSGLSTELDVVKKAAIIDGHDLSTAVLQLNQSLTKTKEFLNTDLKKIEEESEFQRCMERFVETTEPEVAWLVDEEKRIMELVKSTVDCFHGNSGKDEGMKLFLIVRDFLIILDKVCKEVKDAWVKSRKASMRKDSSSSVSSSPDTRQQSSPTIRLHRKLFPAIAEQKVNYDSSSDDEF